MIHIVVLVLTVSAYAPEISEAREVVFDSIEFRIGVKVGGICLLYPDPHRIENIGFVDHADRGELTGGEGYEAVIGHIPVFVALVAEIFKPDPDRVFEILHHVG